MGLNAAARLRQAGADIKKTDVIKFALGSLVVVTKGPAAHPRAHLPVDRALVEHIKVHGIPRERFCVREDGERGEVIDGARRTKAARVAEQELQREAPRRAPLEGPFSGPDDPGRLYVEAEVISCSDLELLLRRLDANVRRGLPDSASVLASIVKSIIAINKGEPDDALMRRIVAAMPQGVTAGVVAALSRWDELTSELQARFDSSEAPIGLLPVVLAARRDEREVVLDKAMRDGVRTAKGATRRANKAKDTADPWARRMTPRFCEALGEALSPFVTSNPGLRDAPKPVVTHVRMGIALGLKLAGARGAAAEEVLSTLPKPIADAIRAARVAGKRKVSPKP